MLKGEAKRDYQREYMRKRRAGEPTRKPPKKWEPTQRMIDEVARWFRRGSWRLRGTARKVVDGLEPNNADGTANEESWNEAMRRYKALRLTRKPPEPPAPPEPKRCSFCGEPATARRTLFGDPAGYPLICARCAKRAVAVIAKQRGGARA